MLSLALAWAEVIEARDIFFGANAVDYSGYPDCRPEYVRAFETMANLATKAGVEGAKLTIHTPIIALTAHAMKADRQRCLDGGCDDYLAKPFETKELLARVYNCAKAQLRLRPQSLDFDGPGNKPFGRAGEP